MSLAAACAEAGGAPQFLGVRFDAAGQPLRCGGSTIVAHTTDAARARLTAVRDLLAAEEAGAAFAWLPPSSYHMTVYDGLLHDRRGPGFWPRDLDASADAATSDSFMLARLTAVPALPQTLRAGVTGASGLDRGGLGLSVTPEGEAGIRAYRDALAAAVGLTDRPGHDSYPFHITLAYQIACPTAEACARFDRAVAAAVEALVADGPIDLGRAEVCLFDDMTHFKPQP